MRPIVPPRPGEVAALASAMPSDGLAGFVMVAAYSGLRLSEVAALKGRDVVERDGVRLVHVRNGKGGKERFSVLLPPAWEFMPGGRGLLFCNEAGNPYDRKLVNKKWQRSLACTGLRFRFHDLRHFFATYALDHGCTDLDVAVALGHTDRFGRPNTELIRRVYGHADPEKALRRIAEAVAA
jgi:integrase